MAHYYEQTVKKEELGPKKADGEIKTAMNAKVNTGTG
jgi:hypothetical protein